MTENEYGVLSTYVGNAKQDLNTQGEVVIGHPRYTVPVICSVIRGGNNAVRNHQAGGATCLSKPALSLTWAAGWSFAKCHFERNVPNDPLLEGMFDGEEFSRMLRLWTHGYDTYTPHRAVVFHDYRHGEAWQRGREGSWGRNRANIKRALKRYNALVERPGAPAAALGRFGLGDRRTVDQYIEFAGIDPRHTKTVKEGLCGKLKQVL